ncbi:MAG: DUF4389 domain-containing protein [Bacteroidota bacterium]
MKLTITRQEDYSRGQLLLRSFFGFIYMIFPHIFIMMFCNIWASILSFISWWVILFTGRYPQTFFDYQVKMLRWSVRLTARMRNLVDGYPAFMPSGTDDLTQLEVTYPESLSRGTLLLRAFFGWLYILIPHGFMLFFRALWGSILSFIAWWAVIFTGRYPESMHAFQVGTIRWGTRVNLYVANMTDNYPPFNGNE